MRTIKSDQEVYLDKVYRFATPANPFEKQLDQYDEWKSGELQGLIEQLRQMGYEVTETAELVKQAMQS